MRLGGEVTWSLTVVARTEKRTFQTQGNRSTEMPKRAWAWDFAGTVKRHIQGEPGGHWGAEQKKGLTGRQEQLGQGLAGHGVFNVTGAMKGFGSGNLWMRDGRTGGSDSRLLFSWEMPSMIVGGTWDGEKGTDSDTFGAIKPPGPADVLEILPNIWVFF